MSDLSITDIIFTYFPVVLLVASAVFLVVFIAYCVKFNPYTFLLNLITPKSSRLSGFAFKHGGTVECNNELGTHAKIPLSESTILIYYCDSNKKETSKLISAALALLSIASQFVSSSSVGFFGVSDKFTYAKLVFGNKIPLDLGFDLSESSFYQRFLVDKMGKQDIKTGDTVFDSSFNLQGNYENNIKQIFKKIALKDLFFRFENLNIKSKFEMGGVEEVCFSCNKHIKHPYDLGAIVEVLKEIHSSMIETADLLTDASS